MKAVIYARYSSDNQREESIEGQIRECTAFAEKNGITILRHYIDRAFSAKTDNRPEFQNMIKDSGKRLFDMIIVWKLDRFARNRYDSARYKAALKKNGVKVVSATEVISDGAEGIILESVLEGYAEYYSADLSEKVVRGMTENALKSKYNGGTRPIGYLIDSDQCFQLDPLTAPFVREAFQRYDEGATMTQIRDWLNEQGVKNTRGQKMTYNSVQHLLNNRRYIGEYTYRDIVVPDGIPAIVPQDLFDRVQEKLAKNKKAPARHKAEDDYLLTTKLFCGYCGAYLCGESGTSHTGNVHHYYKCVSVKKKRTECHKKSVRKEWIEDLVVSETMRMVMDDTAIEAIVSMLMDLQDRENVNLPLYEQQLREADTAIQNLLNAIQQGILTKSTKSRLEELEATKEELETKIACEKLAKPKVSAEFMTFWLHRFRKLDVRQKSHRKMLIDTFINAIFLYDDKMVITFNYNEGTTTITFDDLKSALADQKTGSDLDCSTAPQKESFNRKVGAFLFVLERSGLEPFQAPAIRTTKKKASAVRSELFFLSRLVDTPPAPSNLYRSAGLVACGPVFISSRNCRNLDLPASFLVQYPRPIVGDGVKRTVFIQVVALQRQLANHRKISRIVDPHARIVPRDGISSVRAKAEIVFLQVGRQLNLLPLSRRKVVGPQRLGDISVHQAGTQHHLLAPTLQRVAALLLRQHLPILQVKDDAGVAVILSQQLHPCPAVSQVRQVHNSLHRKLLHPFRAPPVQRILLRAAVEKIPFPEGKPFPHRFVQGDLLRSSHHHAALPVSRAKIRREVALQLLPAPRRHAFQRRQLCIVPVNLYRAAVS